MNISAYPAHKLERNLTYPTHFVFRLPNSLDRRTGVTAPTGHGFRVGYPVPLTAGQRDSNMLGAVIVLAAIYLGSTGREKS